MTSLELRLIKQLIENKQYNKLAEILAVIDSVNNVFSINHIDFMYKNEITLSNLACAVMSHQPSLEIAAAVIECLTGEVANQAKSPAARTALLNCLLEYAKHTDEPHWDAIMQGLLNAIGTFRPSEEKAYYSNTDYQQAPKMPAKAKEMIESRMGTFTRMWSIFSSTTSTRPEQQKIANQTKVLKKCFKTTFNIECLTSKNSISLNEKVERGIKQHEPLSDIITYCNPLKYLLNTLHLYIDEDKNPFKETIEKFKNIAIAAKNSEAAAWFESNLEALEMTLVNDNDATDNSDDWEEQCLSLLNSISANTNDNGKLTSAPSPMIAPQLYKILGENKWHPVLLNGLSWTVHYGYTEFTENIIDLYQAHIKSQKTKRVDDNDSDEESSDDKYGIKTDQQQMIIHTVRAMILATKRCDLITIKLLLKVKGVRRYIKENEDVSNEIKAQIRKNSYKYELVEIMEDLIKWSVDDLIRSALVGREKTERTIDTLFSSLEDRGVDLNALHHWYNKSDKTICGSFGKAQRKKGDIQISIMAALVGLNNKLGNYRYAYQMARKTLNMRYLQHKLHSKYGLTTKYDGLDYFIRIKVDTPIFTSDYILPFKARNELINSTDNDALPPEYLCNLIEEYQRTYIFTKYKSACQDYLRYYGDTEKSPSEIIVYRLFHGIHTPQFMLRPIDIRHDRADKTYDFTTTKQSSIVRAHNLLSKVYLFFDNDSSHKFLVGKIKNLILLELDITTEILESLDCYVSKLFSNKKSPRSLINRSTRIINVFSDAINELENEKQLSRRTISYPKVLDLSKHKALATRLNLQLTSRAHSNSLEMQSVTKHKNEDSTKQHIDIDEGLALKEDFIQSPSSKDFRRLQKDSRVTFLPRDIIFITLNSQADPMLIDEMLAHFNYESHDFKFYEVDESGSRINEDLFPFSMLVKYLNQYPFSENIGRYQHYQSMKRNMNHLQEKFLSKHQLDIRAELSPEYESKYTIFEVQNYELNKELETLQLKMAAIKSAMNVDPTDSPLSSSSVLFQPENVEQSNDSTSSTSKSGGRSYNRSSTQGP